MTLLFDDAERMVAELKHSAAPQKNSIARCPYCQTKNSCRAEQCKTCGWLLEPKETKQTKNGTKRQTKLWTAENLKLLGTMSDAELARLLQTSSDYVGNIRRSRGIVVYGDKKQCTNCSAMIGLHAARCPACKRNVLMSNHDAA